MKPKPEITKECVERVFDSKFIRVFDLQYAEGAHYFDATRHDIGDLAAVKTDEEFRHMLPDAVSICLILKIDGREPLLLLSQEYRYPAGQFLLSPPAGLLDPEDCAEEDPLRTAAVREIREETGIIVKDTDTVSVINPLLFSSPGMTDESNALVCVTVSLEDLDCLTRDNAEGTECFEDFVLLTKEEAGEVLKNGRDSDGKFYSVYTWAVLIHFVWNS